MRTGKLRRNTRPSQRRLNLEALETRKLLAVALVQDIDDRNIAPPPKNLFVAGSVAYFVDYAAAHEQLWKTDGTAAGTSLVKDIYPGGRAYPGNFTNVNGTLYFTADSAEFGQGEIWKSDGTEAGTVLVKDIRPGTVSSFAKNLTNVNGTLYFTVFSALWKSDGTSEGTSQVFSFGTVQNLQPSNGSFVSAGGLLYFLRNVSGQGEELWVSDGTSIGTKLVKDIYAGPTSSQIEEMVASDGKLYFSASTPSSGRELWTSDGTEAGTVQVRDIEAGAASSSPSDLTDVSGVLYFAATNSAASSSGGGGRELYRATATGSATRVRDINPGANGSNPSNLINFNGTLYFTATEPNGGTDLWKSDGTGGGTIGLDIPVSFPDDLIVVGSELFYTTNELFFDSALWKTNGNVGGATFVTDLGEYAQLDLTASVGNKLIFTISGAMNLWASDGTDAGTIAIKENFQSRGSYPDSLAAGLGKIFFNVDFSFYVGNGTATGNIKLLSTRANVSPVEFGGFVYFSASTGSGSELWRSDGTVAGTTQVKDIDTAGYGSYPADLTVVGNTLYFTADDGVNGREIWKSDGTAAGTIRVSQLAPGSESAGPENLFNAGGTLFFTASDDVYGNTELYKSNGTLATTGKIKEIATSGGSYPSNFAELNGKLYFSASDTGNVNPKGEELWVSDGTAAGTVLLQDISPGSGSSNPTTLTRVGNEIFFTASNNGSSTGRELWKTDGTAGGAIQVANITPQSSRSSNIANLTAVGSKVYFSATANGSNNALWVSDGTEAGTTLVKDINSLANESFSNFTSFGGRLVFTANDGPHGNELWVSNGSEAGTFMLKDISTFFQSSSTPQSITPVGDTAFFSANDDVHGNELWKLTFPLVAANTATVNVVEASTATNTGTLKYASTISANFGTVANNGNGTWSWSGTPADGPATIPVTITVTDVDGLTEQTVFNLQVENAPPVVAADAPLVDAGEGSTAFATGTFSDVGVDTIALSASVGTVVDNGDGTWRWSFLTTDGPDESQTVTITATDSDSAVSTATFDLQVLNSAPLIRRTNGTVSVDEGNVATNGGTVSDAGADTYSLTTSFGTVVDNGDGTWSWSAPTTNGPAQSQTVTVTATDSDNASSVTSFELIVNNVPPTVTVDNDPIQVDQAVLAVNSGTYGDIGADAVTLTLSPSDFGTLVDNADGTWSWNYNNIALLAAATQVTVTATDSDGDSSSVSFTANPGRCSTIVLSTANSGPGSLRDAITCSNELLGAQVITFAIPGVGPHTINLTSDLPEITDEVTIDGSSQLGYSTETQIPVIGLNGSGIASSGVDGLRVRADGSVVSSLAIGGFSGDGIEVDSASNVVLAGNYVGLDTNGAALGNGGAGLRMSSANGGFIDGNVFSNSGSAGVVLSGATETGSTLQNNRIGTNAEGTSAMGNATGGMIVETPGNAIGVPGAGNIISGNSGTGLSLLVASASDNAIQGNLIGLNIDGSAALPNTGNGVLVRSANNRIGGDFTLGEANVISGNTMVGLNINGDSNIVEGNGIGVDLIGDTAIPNGSFGIFINGSRLNTIGSLSAGKGNQVSGNGLSGIVVHGAKSNRNVIQGNIIGTKIDGISVLGNTGNGINIRSGAFNNTVKGNVIAGSTNGVLINQDAANNSVGPNNTIYSNTTGVRINSVGNGNRVSLNSIQANSLIGIDIGLVGPTANDPADNDEGSNRSQNFPVIQGPAQVIGTGLRIAYGVNSATSNAAYPLRIEFFRDNGLGQGPEFIGANTYTATDRASGVKTITFATAGSLFAEGGVLTATATDANGNTSEFSATAQVLSPSGVALETARIGTRSPLDVASDGEITPLDALVVINALQARAAGQSLAKASLYNTDVNGDSETTPIDALLVINWLNKRGQPESINEPLESALKASLADSKDSAEGEEPSVQLVNYSLIDSAIADFSDFDFRPGRRSRR